MNVLEHTLGVEEGTLTRALGEITENGLLRLLHYPEQPRLREVMAGHTDGGTITIISASGAGLEILVDGKWNLIPPISRNVFVVSLGDLFRIWTNNQWKSSCIHRVRAVSTDCFRLSLAYFKNQDVEFGTNHAEEESFVQPLPDFRNHQTDIEFGSVNFKGQMKAGMRALRSKASF
jgi:isopenicillin N synthase-like dioxygenase